MNSTSTCTTNDHLPVILFQSLLAMFGAQSSLCHCVSFFQFHICQFFIPFISSLLMWQFFMPFISSLFHAFPFFSSLCQFFMAFLGNVCWDLGLGQVGFPDSPLSPIPGFELRCCSLLIIAVRSKNG